MTNNYENPDGNDSRLDYDCSKDWHDDWLLDYLSGIQWSKLEDSQRDYWQKEFDNRT